MSYQDGALQPAVKLLYTPAEVCSHLGLGRTVVYEFLRTGELPSIRFGRAVRVAHEDLIAFIAARRGRGP